MTLDDIQKLLTEGRIFAKLRNGRTWQVRRNGATKLWKTRPGHFRIPLKVGFKGYTSLDHHDLVDGTLNPELWEVR